MIVQLIATISYQHRRQHFLQILLYLLISRNIILYKTIAYVFGLNFACYFIKKRFRPVINESGEWLLIAMSEMRGNSPERLDYKWGFIIR